MHDLTPTIIFEDTHIIVLSKPAGLLSQGEKTGDPNLVDWLRQYLGRHYVGLIHRLDRNTSGIMVVAKRTKSARRLTDALQAGEIHRTYLGWVEGHLSKSVRWSHHLAKDETKNIVRVVPASAHAKKAILTATPLRHGKRNNQPLTLVEFTLETGRSHQIRAQSAHEGFPLLGDKKYGSRADFNRPALHSCYLKFTHPMTGSVLEFKAPLPPDMANITDANTV